MPATLDRVSKDYPIYIISDDGHRGALGMMALQILGFTKVQSLSGGLQAWKPMPIATPKP